jgi:hypothetical protein
MAVAVVVFLDVLGRMFLTNLMPTWVVSYILQLTQLTPALYTCVHCAPGWYCVHPHSAAASLAVGCAHLLLHTAQAVQFMF